jgi:hypothetical protein
MAHQEIEHTHIPARGINLHVAQVGKGESKSSAAWSLAANPRSPRCQRSEPSVRWSLDCSLMLVS